MPAAACRSCYLWHFLRALAGGRQPVDDAVWLDDTDDCAAVVDAKIATIVHRTQIERETTILSAPSTSMYVLRGPHVKTSSARKSIKFAVRIPGTQIVKKKSSEYARCNLVHRDSVADQREVVLSHFGGLQPSAHRTTSRGRPPPRDDGSRAEYFHPPRQSFATASQSRKL